MTKREKIQAQIDRANETTGAADSTLTAAIGTLIAGYGQGGGGTVETWTVTYYDGSTESLQVVVQE